MRASSTLIEQIERLQVPSGQLALWALGQAGFVVKGSDVIAYIDPYLSDSIAVSGGSARRFPPPLAPGDVRHANYVFATHEHMDHADKLTLGPLMAASPQATLVTSPQARDIALEADIAVERIVTPSLNQRVEGAGLAYTATPAAHYSFEVDAEGRSRWMGFLIECNGITLFHSGDTVIFPELLEALEGKHIDIAILPLNGRDWVREAQNLTGNMWPNEGIDLAQRIGAQVLLACHNDLFAANRVPPGLLWEELDRSAPFVPCHVLAPGELYLFAK